MTAQTDRPPLWISYWAGISAVIVLWDAGYCFCRPRSFGTGDLAWIWAPYNMLPYSEVDLLYGQKAVDENDGFTNAQALLNVIEVILNLEYLYLRHFPPRDSRLEHQVTKVERYHGHAPLVGFSSALMTLSKTALYFLQDYYGGWPSIGHNTVQNLIIWTATNSVSDWQLTDSTWIVVPFFVCVVLGQFISKILNRQHASDIAYVEWAQSHPSSSASDLVKKVQREEIVKDSAKPNGGAKVSTRTSPVSGSSSFDPSAEAHTAASTKELARTKDGTSDNAVASSSSSSSSYPIVYPGAALPLTFHPNNRKALVVGNRRLAASRAFAFLEADASVILACHENVNLAHEELQHRINHHQVEYLQVNPKSQEDWKNVLVSHEISLLCVTDTMIGARNRTPESAQAIYEAATSLNIPVNISDYPALSTYTFPSVHRFQGSTGPSHLQVAVSTNGRGCRLSGRIKREIVSKLPPVIGAAVDNVGRLRERAKSVSRISEDDVETPLNTPVFQLDTPSLLRQASYQLAQPKEADAQQMRRMRWVHQMSEYYSLEALARLTDEDLNRALDTWKGDTLPHHEGLDESDVVVSSRTKGRISLIGSGPGHPSLLTVAALHSLRNATLILSDKLVPSEILALIPQSTKLHIAKKFPGNNEGAQNEMMVMALEGARAGEDVVRLKQGDPFVYGRGGEEVLYFREHGFECTLIPGVSSALAGPLMMGIPVTQRGVAESMIMCTGVGRAGKAVQLPGYIKSRTTCILMGVARISAIVEVLTSPDATGRDGTAYPYYLPIAIIERASSPDQRVVLSTLENIADALKAVDERPPGMMLVGWAALCLEGNGRVDILDTEAKGGEEEIVKEWLGGDRWKVREGLGVVWDEFMRTVEAVHSGLAGGMGNDAGRSVSRGRERLKVG